MNSLTCGIIVTIYVAINSAYALVKSCDTDELLYLMMMMMVSKDENIIRPLEPTGRILMAKMDTVDKIKKNH